MNSELTFNSKFIHEFTPGSMPGVTESTIVYHYTSPDAFLSIVQGRSVRFSDIRYMNDKSESFFFVKRLLEFCEENKEQYQHFTDVVNELLKENSYSAIKKLKAQDIRYTEFPGLKMGKQRNFIFCISKVQFKIPVLLKLLDQRKLPHYFQSSSALFLVYSEVTAASLAESPCITSPSELQFNQPET